jgi:hypothetical protein
MIGNPARRPLWPRERRRAGHLIESPPLQSPRRPPAYVVSLATATGGWQTRLTTDRELCNPPVADRHTNAAHFAGNATPRWQSRSIPPSREEPTRAYRYGSALRTQRGTKGVTRGMPGSYVPVMPLRHAQPGGCVSCLPLRACGVTTERDRGCPALCPPANRAVRGLR